MLPFEGGTSAKLIASLISAIISRCTSTFFALKHHPRARPQYPRRQNSSRRSGETWWPLASALPGGFISRISFPSCVERDTHAQLHGRFRNANSLVRAAAPVNGRTSPATTGFCIWPCMPYRDNGATPTGTHDVTMCQIGIRYFRPSPCILDTLLFLFPRYFCTGQQSS